MPRKYLNEAKVDEARRQIVQYLQQHSSEWGIHGWGFVGPPGKQRLQVYVNRTLAEPGSPVTSIPLPDSVGGGRLKPKVVASNYLGGPCAPPARSLELDLTGAGAAIDQLAPGAVIDVEDGLQGGIACVLSADGQAGLVTCGHIFPPGADGNEVYFKDEAVAELKVSFLEEKLDAAFCPLTDEGMEMLKSAAGAPSWCWNDLAPVAVHRGREALFWPSGQGGGAVTGKVCSEAVTQYNFECELWQYLTFDNLIAVSGIPVVKGDSGSLLTLDRAYYGLCTGRKGAEAYFTAIHRVIARLKQQHQEVKPWHFE